MGMYDSIIFLCPNCSRTIIVQSKGGECQLKKYYNTSVPGDSAAYVIEDEVTCDNCKMQFIVTGDIPRTNLTLKPKKDFSYD